MNHTGLVPATVYCAKVLGSERSQAGRQGPFTAVGSIPAMQLEWNAGALCLLAASSVVRCRGRPSSINSSLELGYVIWCERHPSPFLRMGTTLGSRKLDRILRESNSNLRHSQCRSPYTVQLWAHCPCTNPVTTTRDSPEPGSKQVCTESCNPIRQKATWNYFVYILLFLVKTQDPDKCREQVIRS